MVSFAESAYDQLSREFNFQIKDPVPLIFYATHSAFEQNNIILNFIPEGVGAFATPGPLPHGAADRPAGRRADAADPPRADPHLPVPHAVPGQPGQGGRHLAAHLVHGGHGELHGEGRERARQDVPARRGGQRPHPARSAATDSAASSPTASATRSSTSSRSAGARKASSTSSTRSATPSARGSDRAVKRAFKLEPEDFDLEFRRWLRKKYLPQLVETGEPGDFGRVFRIENERDGRPGDLAGRLALGRPGRRASAPTRGDVDVVLFDAQKRQLSAT